MGQGRAPGRSGSLLGGGVMGMLALSIATSAWVAQATPMARAPSPPPPGERPERIVSATLSTDEILLALLGPEALVGVTRYALDPEVSNVVDEARRVPHVITGDAEPILALEPDVLFSDPVGSPETRALLRRAGVPVLEVPPCYSLDDVRRNVRWVGRRVGEASAAEDLVRGMDAIVDGVRARLEDVEPPRVLLWNRGGYTAGAGTLFDEVVSLAGGRNAAAEAGVAGHASLPLERALALDPDVILTTDYRAGGQSRRLVPEPALMADPSGQGVRAVREGRVYPMDGRHLLSTSHHAARAVQDVARALHPERFGRGP